MSENRLFYIENKLNAWPHYMWGFVLEVMSDGCHSYVPVNLNKEIKKNEHAVNGSALNQ